MATNSAIGWTDHTANLWWGCEEIADGCKNCYARDLAKRYNHLVWGPEARRPIKGVWRDFRKWESAGIRDRKIYRVFVGSMMDIFERSRPLLDGPLETRHLRDKFFTEIVPFASNLEFVLLTKRPSNIMKMVPEHWKHWFPKNVTVGVSISDQKTADTLLPQLFSIPAARLVVSIEPLIDAVRLGEAIQNLSWVIVGGESGKWFRKMPLPAFISLFEECKTAGVPFYTKQDSGPVPGLQGRIPHKLWAVKEFPAWA